MKLAEFAKEMVGDLFKLVVAIGAGLGVANFITLGNLDLLASGIIYGALFMSVTLWGVIAHHKGKTHDGISELTDRLERAGVIPKEY